MLEHIGDRDLGKVERDIVESSFGQATAQDTLQTIENSMFKRDEKWISLKKFWICLDLYF